MLKFLRIIGFVEGISYLALFGITMPLKYLYSFPEPNYYVGLAHGVLFTMYVGLVLIVGYQKRWKLIITFWALLASLLPFATFVADAKIFRRADESDLVRK